MVSIIQVKYIIIKKSVNVPGIKKVKKKKIRFQKIDTFTQII